MKYVVAFYAVDRAYGGPEEGSWWYDTGELVRLHRVCLTEAAASRLAVRANRLLDLLQPGQRRLDPVLYAGGRYRACVFEHAVPPRFPQALPRYE